jgi:hypothetical protein
MVLRKIFFSNEQKFYRQEQQFKVLEKKKEEVNSF